MKKGLKWTVAFLAAVAASVFSLAATAGEDEVLLDVPDNYELTEAELNEIGEDFISRED